MGLIYSSAATMVNEDMQQDADKFFDGDRTFFRPDLRPCYLVSRRLEPIDAVVTQYANSHRLVPLKNAGRRPGRALREFYTDAVRTLNLTSCVDPRRSPDIDAILFRVELAAYRRCSGAGYWSRVDVWEDNIALGVVVAEIDRLLADGWDRVSSWSWPNCPEDASGILEYPDWKWNLEGKP